MLSDGEFVMNARAVQGAGGGDRKAGAIIYHKDDMFEQGGGYICNDICDNVGNV